MRMLCIARWTHLHVCHLVHLCLHISLCLLYPSQLSTLEKFYVHVAEVYQQQELEKHVKIKEEQQQDQMPPEHIGAPHWPFAEAEKKLFMCRFQLDNIITMIDQLRSNPQQLTLSQRNTESYDNSRAQQSQSSDDDMVTDDPTPSSSSSAPDERNISASTKRKRYGVLMMAKRRQLMKASESLQQAAHRLESAITSNRLYLSNLHTISQHWSARITHISPAQIQQAKMSGGSYQPPQEIKVNNYKHAQRLSLYPSIPLQSHQHLQFLHAGTPGITMPFIQLDYRINNLSTDSDRGRSYIYRDDAGEVYIDDHVGKMNEEEQTEFERRWSQQSLSHPAQSSRLADGSVLLSPPSVRASLIVHRLYRQQRLLVNQLMYEKLMSEAREIRHALSSSTSPSSSSSSSPRAWYISRVSRTQIAIQVNGVKFVPLSSAAIGGDVEPSNELIINFHFHPLQSHTLLSFSLPLLSPSQSSLLFNICLTLFLQGTHDHLIKNRPYLETIYGLTDKVKWSPSSPHLLLFLLMHIIHIQLRRQLKQSLQAIVKGKLIAQLPAGFRVEYTKPTEPYIFIFELYIGSKFVAQGIIRGVNFTLSVALPSASPSSHSSSLSSSPSASTPVEEAIGQAVEIREVDEFVTMVERICQWHRQA